MSAHISSLSCSHFPHLENGDINRPLGNLVEESLESHSVIPGGRKAEYYYFPIM